MRRICLDVVDTAGAGAAVVAVAKAAATARYVCERSNLTIQQPSSAYREWATGRWWR